MGLRSWILEPYAKDFEELKSEVKTLQVKMDELSKNYQDMLKELLKIQKALKDKADKKIMERELESLSKLVEDSSRFLLNHKFVEAHCTVPDPASD